MPISYMHASFAGKKGKRIFPAVTGLTFQLYGISKQGIRDSVKQEFQD